MNIESDRSGRRFFSYRIAGNFLVSGLVFLLSGCGKSERIVPIPPSMALPSPTGTSEAAPSPSPAISNSQNAALPKSESSLEGAKSAPASNEAAPKGIYFVVKEFSVTTHSGIVGFWQGEQVKLVKEQGNKLVVTDGETQVIALWAFFTNNPDVAKGLAKRATAKPTPAAITQQQIAEVIRARNLETAKLLDQQNRDLAAKKKERLQADVAALNARINAAREEIAQKKSTQRPIRRIYSPDGVLLSYQGASMYTLSLDASGINRLTAERDRLTAEIARLQSQ